jgi:transcriptional regulator with XRE-family HTH domain
MSDRSAFRPEFVDQARKLAELGATDEEVAEFFEVERRTIYRWKHSKPEFAAALKTGKEAADDRVEHSLYRRALGYSHEAVKISISDGQEIITPYVEHYPPDTTACIFWLKNRRRAEWRDKVEHEHAGPDGGPIQTEDTALARWIALKLMTATAQPVPATLAITGDK